MMVAFRGIIYLSILLATLLAYALPASAQRLVSKLSAQEISINSTFTGESLTLFGNVEPPIGADGREVEGPFDIVIVIQGPSITRVVRRKSPQFGVWLNAEQVEFTNIPSFYHVLATGPLEKITDPETLSAEGIGLDFQVVPLATDNPAEDKLFANELLRLMTKAKMYGLKDRRVSFLSETFYNARLILPANVPNGTYLAKTYLFKNGDIVDERAERFVVRTTGAERFFGNAARDYPLAYGLATVLLALFTGWLGGVAFRR
jgi:uncharacterized protein (TIGR02186 family)